MKGNFRVNKKIYLVIISFIILICYSCKGYCEVSGTIYLETNKQVIEIDQEVEIIVSMQNAETVAYNLYLYFDNSKLEYISGPENTNLVENCIISVWHDKDGGRLAKSGELAKFVFKAKENGIALFNIEGEFYNNDDELIKTEFNKVQIQIGEINVIQEDSNIKEEKINESNLENNSKVDEEAYKIDNKLDRKEIDINSNILDIENANIEALAIENVLLYPPFDVNIIEYSVEISKENSILNIFAVPENENASLEILGNQDLKVGNNLIKIIVTAQDGITKKEYIINAYKRNNDEEAEYNQKQENNKQKLEEIYKAEKINLQVENLEEENIISIKKQKNGNFNLIFVLLIILIIAGILYISIYKVRKRNRN